MDNHCIDPSNFHLTTGYNLAQAFHYHNLHHNHENHSQKKEDGQKHYGEGIHGILTLSPHAHHCHHDQNTHQKNSSCQWGEVPHYYNHTPYCTHPDPCRKVGHSCLSVEGAVGLVLGRIHVVVGVGNWACTGHYSVLSLVVDYCSYQVEVLL